MRIINVEEITKNIKEMCIEANHFLSKDMDIALKNAVQTEKSPLGKQILNQLQENVTNRLQEQNILLPHNAQADTQDKGYQHLGT